MAGVWLQVRDRGQAGRRIWNNLPNIRKRLGSQPAGGQGKGDDAPCSSTSSADGRPYLISAEA